MNKINTMPEKKEKKSQKTPLLAKKLNLIVLMVVGISALSAGFYFLWINPQWSRIKEGGALYLPELEARLQERQTAKNELKRLSSNFSAIDTEDVKTVSVILPQTKQVPELLSQLETMSRQNGVQLLNVDIIDVQQTETRRRQQQAEAAPQLDENIQDFRLTIEVRSFDYPAFKSFLRALETHKRILDLNNFTFSKDLETQQLQLTGYHLKSEE